MGFFCLFILLFSLIFKLLLGFRNAQEYWEELFQKNIYIFFLFRYNNLLHEFLAQNCELIFHGTSPVLFRLLVSNIF